MFVLAQNLEVYELKLIVVSWFVLVVRIIWFLTDNKQRKQCIKLQSFSVVERFYYKVGFEWVKIFWTDTGTVNK